MRPLEWVLLLSFVPLVLGLLVPVKRRPQGWFYVALLPVVATMAQIGVEGWRVQVIPLYVLSVIGFTAHLPYFRQADRSPPRWRGIVESVVIVLMLVGTWVFAGWLLPVADLPAPSGEYAVGSVEQNFVYSDEDGSRELMLTIWYPTDAGGETASLFTHPTIVSDALGEFFGLPSVLLQHLRYIDRQATPDAPVATEGAPFPVLVFSHGLSGIRAQNTSMLQEMASHGYVVVAMDHPYSSAVTVFPDEEAIYYDLTHFGIPYEGFGVPDSEEIDFNFSEALDENLFPVWVEDHTRVYDRLANWNAEGKFTGALDLERVGSFGHSFGGATATVVCDAHELCDAAVNLDGPLFGVARNDADFAMSKPYLLLAAPSDDEEKLARWERVVENASAPAYWGRLPNSTHYSFTDSQLLSPAIEPDNYNPRAGLQVQYDYLRVFFGQYVRDESSELIASIPDTGDVMEWVLVNTEE